MIIDCEKGESQMIRDGNPIKEEVRGWCKGHRDEIQRILNEFNSGGHSYDGT